MSTTKVRLSKYKVEDSAGRAKHIAVRIKILKDHSKMNITKVVYFESHFVRADIITETFVAPRLTELREIISLV